LLATGWSFDALRSAAHRLGEPPDAWGVGRDPGLTS